MHVEQGAGDVAGALAEQIGHRITDFAGQANSPQADRGRNLGTAGRVWLAAAAALCCGPLLAVYLVPAPAWLAVALTLSGVCTVAALSLTYVNAQALLPENRRGLGTGMISATIYMVASTGPTLVALSSQHLLSGPMALPQSIALVGAASSVLAALVLAVCARGVGRAGVSRPAVAPHHR